MIEPWVTMVVAILYVSILFAVASYGDRIRARAPRNHVSKPNIYALSLAVYCTTWTFFGSVGLASTSGLSFLAIYVGPVLAITLGYPVIRHIVKLSRQERITSVADFLSARYGKSNKVAAVAAMIAVIGTVPYIALQLKAISASVDTLVTEFSNGFPVGLPPFGDVTFFVAAVLALFAVLFGTRHADATEHQHGLMLAIALESVIKLVAFLCVGVFVTWFMFDGVTDILSKAAQNANVQNIVSNGFDTGNFLVLTCLSLIVFLLLPRQFHVAVVENNTDAELKRARWLFPIYLVAINLFVIPIAIAGTLRFGIAANADDFVLLLPLLEGQRALGLLVFLGGLSAGTAMVIVASVALAIMVSNDLVLPSVLRSRAIGGRPEPQNMERFILNIRRTAIFGVLALSYIYYTLADNTAALASIGLVSFVAIAQLAPSFFLGMVWKNANARGAIAGMLAGFAVWAYCLLLPTLLPENNDFVVNGPFSLTTLKPENLFGLDISPIANGFLWSLLANTTVFILGSVSRDSDLQENLQASLFINFQGADSRPYLGSGSTILVADLKETLSRYLGQERTERAFANYSAEQLEPRQAISIVDEDMLRFSEQLLASAVGASSSRLIHTLLLQRHAGKSIDDIQLLDEASRAIQFNRDMLQTAFDQLEQGVTVFDKDLRLASWNRQFRSILNLPAMVGQAGLPILEVAEAVIRNNPIEEDGLDAELLTKKLVDTLPSWQLCIADSGVVLEISSSPMPEGGIVVTWHDITERVMAAKALEEANETLEKRVEERTYELEEAKLLADQANASKTRFLAAAGHDIVQPLNAARLYSATLIERLNTNEDMSLADNIGKSLGSVEEILGSILAISRLDSAKPEVNISSFPLKRITEQLEIEFEPIAATHGLDLRFVHSSKWVKSDPALLRRLLQNLISNAIKFTPNGTVLVGVRRVGDQLLLCVHDTGIGMDEHEQELVFAEFTRLNEMKNEVPGLGLGLSIVDRIADLLGHRIGLVSQKGRGTFFSIELKAVAAIESLPTDKHRVRKSATGRLNGMRILCVDNEPSILEGMQALLSQWGCEVWCASNQDEASTLIRAEKLDAVLVDYHLDTGTGIELYRSVKNDLSSTAMAILITADRSEAVKTMVADAGMTLLNKPVKPAALRALLSQGRVTTEAAE